jgi:hypothetical protein
LSGAVCATSTPCQNAAPPRGWGLAPRRPCSQSTQFAGSARAVCKAALALGCPLFTRPIRLGSDGARSPAQAARAGCRRGEACADGGAKASPPGHAPALRDLGRPGRRWSAARPRAAVGGVSEQPLDTLPAELQERVPQQRQRRARPAAQRRRWRRRLSRTARAQAAPPRSPWHCRRGDAPRRRRNARRGQCRA